MSTCVSPVCPRCRRKVRMSCLCKVRMSAFLGAGRPDGTGADQLEPTRTGAVEGVARSPARSSETSSSRSAFAADRTAHSALTATPANRGRSRADASVARISLEPEDPRSCPAAHAARVASGALCRFWPHAGRRASGGAGPGGESRDVAELDECCRIVADTPDDQGSRCTSGARVVPRSASW
jgi:hypothetical protein